MNGPKLTPLAASLPEAVPFVGPERQEREAGRLFRARLGANENVFGPSSQAVGAMAAAAMEAWKYGDPDAHDLRQALATHHGVDPACIMIGEGIDGLLGVLVRLLVGPGTPVVTSLGAYPTFNFHVAGFGGTLHTVPYSGDHEDPDALARKARETGAVIAYLANPDNPMGSWHKAEVLQQMLDALPEGCLLCLDEAYCEFAPAESVPAFDTSDPRIIRMRTFSKAYGLAGIRVGYAIGHKELIAAFDRVRNHFGVGNVSQAGALAALNDVVWLQSVIADVANARTRIGKIARANGLKPLPSATNFVTIDCGRDGAFSRALLDDLLGQGIFVRMPFSAGQDRCIRVSCGTKADLDLFAEVLPIALSRVAGQG